MPDLTTRLPQNAPGKYYVDDNCIDCDMCRGTAPTVFGRDDSIGFSIVQRQPETEEEIAAAEEAMNDCPSECIGNDAAPVV
jgi:ferredoxin